MRTFNEFKSIFGSIKEDDAKHRAHLDKTGFWGKEGAGVVFMAKDTGRLLIAKRSRHVQEPGTWSTWGGALDEGEDALAGAKREAEEEAGAGSHVISYHMVHEFVVPDKFKYTTFIALVETEFRPSMNWETANYEWVEYGDWPTPIHRGFAETIKEPSFRRTYEELR